MSRQRHGNKRNDARAASMSPKQRRQANKAAHSSAASAGTHKKRPVSSAPQRVAPSDTTSKATTDTTAKAAAPKATGPKAQTAPKPRKSTGAGATKRARQATVVTDDAAVIFDKPATAQPPEMPEAMVLAETLEATEGPAISVTPEEPSEPATSAEVDTPGTPGVRAPEMEPHEDAGIETHESEATGELDALIAPDTLVEPGKPAASGQRMPTLAVMAQLRRVPASTTDRAATDTSANDDAVTATDAVEGVEDMLCAPDVSQKTAIRRLREQVRSAREPQQETTLVTRLVSTRYSNRQGSMPRTPDLFWESDPRLAYLPWPLRRHSAHRPQPMPPANVLIPLIVSHIFVMAILGLIGALFGLNGQGTLGPWMLFGAVISGLGGATAYVLSESASRRRFAPLVLVVSQLALLAWSLTVFGPRASLLALTPALIEVMLLMGSTWLACGLGIGSLAVYALVAGLSISIGLAPVSMLNATETVVLDVVCVVVGMLVAIWLLLAIQSGREHAQAIARARRHEADVLRNLMTRFRQEVQDDTSKLEAALIQALKGHGIAPIPAEGMYRLLAETIMDTAARLEVLQRDREERVRLEGSLSVLIRAVERQWLGIDPEWPEHTGTTIDELVALLRTPRPNVAYQNDDRSQSIEPRLIPIPTLSVDHETPPPTPISRPLNGTSWRSPRRARRPDLYPLPSANEDHSLAGDGDAHSSNGNNAAWHQRDFWQAQDDD